MKTEEEIRNIIETESLFVEERGSVVYGTSEANSDVDLIVVLPNSYFDFIKELGGVNGIARWKCGILDYQITTDSKFKSLLESHDVMVVEAIYTPWKHLRKGINYRAELVKGFHLDKWKLRQSFSKVASNSWVKAKKKMTVEKDYDLRCGQKSLFHCLRILNFALQICKRGEIMSFSACNSLYKEIIENENPVWETYKEKYHEYYNSLSSQLREVAPKPVGQ